MGQVRQTCEKYNCTLEPNHDGWHVKKGARGKVIISWLDGQWKSADGHGTYRYQEPTLKQVYGDDYSPRYDPDAPEYGEAD